MGKNIKYFMIDAFTNERFRGNPAGVCVLEEPLDAALMQRIAAENNLPETAFLLKTAGGYSLRCLPQSLKSICAATQRWLPRLSCSTSWNRRCKRLCFRL